MRDFRRDEGDGQAVVTSVVDDDVVMDFLRRIGACFDMRGFQHARRYRQRLPVMFGSRLRRSTSRMCHGTCNSDLCAFVLRTSTTFAIPGCSMISNGYSARDSPSATTREQCRQQGPTAGSSSMGRGAMIAKIDIDCATLMPN